MTIATLNDTIEQQLRDFMAKYIFFSEDFPVSDETSFLDSGLVDSMNVAEIVHHTEAMYGISISDHEIVPDNFDSIQNIARFVRNKTGQAA